MLLPLPGNSGYWMEQMPISSPAAAIAGISTQDLMVWPDVLGHDVVERQPHTERQWRQDYRESREQIGQLGVRPVAGSGLMGYR